MKTSKRALSLLLAAVMVFSMFPMTISAASLPSVTLELKDAKTSYQAGELFSVDVYLNNASAVQPIKGYGFVFEYDSSMLTPATDTVDYAYDYFDQNDAGAMRTWSGTVGATITNFVSVVYGGSNPYSVEADAEILLGTLNFTVKTDAPVGSTSIGFTTDFSLVNTKEQSVLDDSNAPIAAMDYTSVASINIVKPGVNLDTTSVNVNGSADVTVQATAISDDGSDVTDTATWSVSPTTGGVSVATGGVITVDKDATAGDYTISALGVTGTATLTVTEAALTAIEIMGDTAATVIAKDIKTVTLSATGTYEGGSTATVTSGITWSIDPAVEGASVSSSGVVSIEDNVSGDVTVKAAAAANSSISDTHTIVVTRPAPSVRSVAISGAGNVNVPTVAAGDYTESFTATFTDQYGDTFTPTTTTTWSITNGDTTGISIDNNGVLTVSPTANGGQYIIIKAANFLSDEHTVVVNKAAPVATSIAVTSATDTLAVPVVNADGDIQEATTTFTATVTDQFGAPMTGETVTWKVTNADGATVEGVSIANGVVTVESNASIIGLNYTMTVTATAAGFEATAELTLTKNASVDTSIDIYSAEDTAFETKLNGTTISVTKPIGDTNATYELVAEVLDQYGIFTSTNPAMGYTDTPSDGITFESGTTFTVTKDATASDDLHVVTANVAGLNATVNFKVVDINIVWPTVSVADSTPTYGDNWTDILSKTGGSADVNGANVEGDFSIVSKVPAVGDTTYEMNFLSSDGNYDVTAPFSESVTISPATLTVTGLDATDRPYDGTTDVALTGGTVEGFVNSESTADLTGFAMPTSGTVTDGNVGTGKLVSFTGPTTTNDNYEFGAISDIEVDITKKPITLDAVTIAPKTFDGTTTANATATFTNVVGSEVVNYTAVADYNNANAGTTGGSGTVTLETTGVAANYSLADGGFTFSGSTPAIAKATWSGSITPNPITVIETDVSEKTITFPTSELPADALADSDSFVFASTAPTDVSSVLEIYSVDSGTGTVTFKLKDAAVDGDMVTIHALVKSTNYNDIAVDFVINVSDKFGASVAVSGVPTGIIYVGDQFQLDAIATPDDTTGEGATDAANNASYTYSVSPTTAASVDAAGVVTILEDGNMTFTATYSSDTHAGNGTANATANNKVTISVVAVDPTGHASDDGVTDFLNQDSFTVGALTPVAGEVNSYKVQIKGTKDFVAYDSSNPLQGNAEWFGLGIGNFAVNGGTAIDITAGLEYYGGGVVTGTGSTFADTADSTSVNLTAKEFPLYLANGKNGMVNNIRTIALSDGTNDVILTIELIPYVAPSEERPDRDDSSTSTPSTDNSDEDRDTGITLEGDFTGNLSVTVVGAGTSVYGDLFEAMADGIAKLGYTTGFKVLAAYDIEVEEVDGRVKLSFPVGDEYNNKRFFIVHQKNDGDVEVYTGRVSDGIASVTVDELSPFMIAIEDESGLPFIDVISDAWYFEAIAYVYDNGIMSGVSDNMFNPDGTATRGMVATILHRIEGEPEVELMYANFMDVAQGSWYEQSIAWAVKEGILNGIAPETMGPDNAVTREQFVTMLYRYAGSPTGAAELTFSDVADLSDWAEDAMAWAVAEGIITGRDGNMLVPQGTATRAELSTMMMRYMSK